MSTLFERSFRIAELMFLASSTPTYVTMIEADHTGRDVGMILTRWAGGIGVDPEPVMYGSWKAYTLLAKGQREGISRTPLTDFLHGCPYAGGLRENQHIVACSVWDNDKVDLMLAALLMYSLSNEVRFHHAGFGYSSEEACLDGVERCSGKFNSKSLPLNSSGTRRLFVRVESKLSPNGNFWIEHQYSQKNPKLALHWDIATSDPEDMISYISYVCDIKAQFIKREQGSPCASVAIKDTNGTEIAIMARPNWSTVESW